MSLTLLLALASLEVGHSQRARRRVVTIENMAFEARALELKQEIQVTKQQ